MIFLYRELDPIVVALHHPMYNLPPMEALVILLLLSHPLPVVSNIKSVHPPLTIIHHHLLPNITRDLITPHKHTQNHTQLNPLKPNLSNEYHLLLPLLHPLILSRFPLTLRNLVNIKRLIIIHTIARHTMTLPIDHINTHSQPIHHSTIKNTND